MQRLRLASTVGWGFPTWNEDDECALLTGFGIAHVQVFRNGARNISPIEIRRRLADSGIRTTSLHSFFGDAWDPSQLDETARRRAVQSYAQEAEFCLALGGNLVVVHPGHPQIGDDTRNPARVAALARSAEELARLGEKTGVLFVLENLQRGQMGDDMAMLRRVVDQVDSPRLLLNYDCGHANLTSDPLTVLEQAGPRIASTHIHDNLGDSDDHLVPGEGSVDMDAVCRGLARWGYRGEFVLELMQTTDVVRRKCDAAWQARLSRWLDLASGLIP